MVRRISRLDLAGTRLPFCCSIFLHAWRKLRWPNLVSNYSCTNGDCSNYGSRLNRQVNHDSVVIKRLIIFLSRDGLYIGGETSSSVHMVSLSSSYFRATQPQSSPSRRRHTIGVGRAGSPKPTSPRVPARGRGRIRFSGSAVATARGRLLSLARVAGLHRRSDSSIFASFGCRQPHCKNV